MALKLTSQQATQAKACEEAAAIGIPWLTLIQWILANAPLAFQVISKVIPFIRGGGSVADGLLWAEACFAAGSVVAGPPLAATP